MKNSIIRARVAELADAPDLGSGISDVQVQVLLPALKNPVLVSPGFFVLTAIV